MSFSVDIVSQRVFHAIDQMRLGGIFQTFIVVLFGVFKDGLVLHHLFQTDEPVVLLRCSHCLGKAVQVTDALGQVEILVVGLYTPGIGSVAVPGVTERVGLVKPMFLLVL